VHEAYILVSLLLYKDYIADSEIYTIFISALCKYGNINEALKAFNEAF